MSIKKRYLKRKPVCKVTFILPKEMAKSARTVDVVGEFNNWQESYATPMKRLKNGTFSVSIELERGREYQFRYLINKTDWEKDTDADKYIRTFYGDCENSVVVV